MEAIRVANYWSNDHEIEHDKTIRLAPIYATKILSFEYNRLERNPSLAWALRCLSFGRGSCRSSYSAPRPGDSAAAARPHPGTGRDQPPLRHHFGARQRLARDRARRTHRPARALGLRQDHAAPDHRRLPAADRRRG